MSNVPHISKPYLIEGNAATRPLGEANKLDFRMEGESGEITIYIYGRIYEWASSDFARLHARAIRDGVKKMHLRINSLGGSVFAGNAIYNLLKSSPIEIITYNDGVAASMASIILRCGNIKKGAKSSMLMIHNPSGLCHGEASKMRKCAELLDLMTDTLATIYSEDSPLSEEEVKAAMSKETWYSAKQMLENGWVDELYDAPTQAPSKEALADPEALYMHFAAQLSTPVPTSDNQPKISKTTDMDLSKMAIMLGLPHDADEKTVTEKLTKVKAQAATVEDLQKEVDTANASKVKTLIDGAIAAGKITEKQRPLYTQNAMKDYDLTAQMLAEMAVAVKPTDLINKGGSASAAVNGDKKFTDYSDGELEALRGSDWAAYAKLFHAHFKYTPVKTKVIPLGVE